MFLVGQLKIFCALKKDGQVPRSNLPNLKRSIVPEQVCLRESLRALHVSMCSCIPMFAYVDKSMPGVGSFDINTKENLF